MEKNFRSQNPLGGAFLTAHALDISVDSFLPRLFLLSATCLVLNSSISISYSSSFSSSSSSCLLELVMLEPCESKWSLLQANRHPSLPILPSHFSSNFGEALSGLFFSTSLLSTWLSKNCELSKLGAESDSSSHALLKSPLI
ncbi:hypothetical protein BpHYR1_012104 [Brachionus plicatilis]|uniref:Uncharacterized protein n=1 Tax=Brachionus plicatilis TaxID=10195 RepID=A0A3M7R3Q0_BRAPC|nr:hypothetical protein BpHYR1_012104 [Brachionus plicatilis]